jgi:hypothetical protein
VAFWVTLTICALFGALWWRAEPLLSRLVGVAEKKAERPKLAVRKPMPAHLQMIANQESEKWARDEKERLFNEMYEETGDWDQVGMAVGAVG